MSWHERAGPAPAAVVGADREWWAAMVTVASPWGPVQLAASELGVCGVELWTEPAGFASSVGRRIGGLVVDVAGIETDPATAGQGRALEQLARAKHELERELGGEPSRVGEVPLDFTGVAAFDRRVLEAVRGVLRGETLTYGELARRIGAPRAARAVGGAVGRDPFWLLVPCHRIIAAGGRLGGYGGWPYGPELKRELLAREGVVVTLERSPAPGRADSPPGRGGEGRPT